MAEDPEYLSWIEAQWDAPPWIRAGISTRHGGYSQPPYESLNLAYHVGDNPETVTLNRRYLKDLLDLPSEPLWLNQVHGNRIIEAGSSNNLDADGSYTEKSRQICVIMTADCLPLLLCDKSGSKIAAVHVGWRGYCSGIITSALKAFHTKSQNLFVWLGPHISEKNYEVGDDVYYSCINRHNEACKYFTKSRKNHWYANLEMLARHELTVNNVNKIFNSNQCTFENNSEFFSYRRQKLTGRMASMIWIDK